jgi:hypothetical protein
MIAVDASGRLGATKAHLIIHHISAVANQMR